MSVLDNYSPAPILLDLIITRIRFEGDYALQRGLMEDDYSQGILIFKLRVAWKRISAATSYLYMSFAGKINFHAHALKGEELHFPHWHTPLSGSLMMSVLCSGDKLNEAGY